MKVSHKNGSVVLVSPGRWALAAGIDKAPENTPILAKESYTWIDKHNITQRVTTIRMFRVAAITLSRSTNRKADILAVGRWRRLWRSIQSSPKTSR